MSRSEQPSVLIVGAGLGGIGAAIELKRAGFHDIVVLEKAGDLGGVYSFEPNPLWPMRFSLRADIHAYLARTADKYGVTPHIRFNSEVTNAAFDAGAGLWRIESSTGATYSANVFVPAVGQLSRPSFPDIPGRETFAGHSFHSALWDHDQDLTGKRVAVIGTGASAILCEFATVGLEGGPAITKIAQPNVRVETNRITEITPTGMSTADGTRHEVDVIIYGTNTNLGCGSIIYMLERQARYIRQAVSYLAATGSSHVDVRREVADRFDDEVQRRLARSVWTRCHSWYREASGRVSTNWPGLVSEYHRRTKTLDPSDYRVTR